MNKSDLAAFVAEKLGHQPQNLSLFERALTHSSAAKDSYERLEFLGDRVLGLIIACWLYEKCPAEPEGKLSRRYNVLVARETCGEIGRNLGLPALIRLGKQARDDRANHGDNVVGDVVEALIGALFLDGGVEAAETFVRRCWSPRLESQGRVPQHPKSALQELAAARGLAAPEYQLIDRSGAHHSPCFALRVSIKGVGEATAQGASKQEAETAAAAALLEQLQ